MYLILNKQSITFRYIFFGFLYAIIGLQMQFRQLKTVNKIPRVNPQLLRAFLNKKRESSITSQRSSRSNEITQYSKLSSSKYQIGQFPTLQSQTATLSLESKNQKLESFRADRLESKIESVEKLRQKYEEDIEELKLRIQKEVKMRKQLEDHILLKDKKLNSVKLELAAAEEREVRANKCHLNYLKINLTLTNEKAQKDIRIKELNGLIVQQNQIMQQMLKLIKKHNLFYYLDPHSLTKYVTNYLSLKPNQILPFEYKSELNDNYKDCKIDILDEDKRQMNGKKMVESNDNQLSQLKNEEIELRIQGIVNRKLVGLLDCVNERIMNEGIVRLNIKYQYMI